MQTFTKKDIVKRVAKKLNLEEAYVYSIIQAGMDEMINSLASGERLEFRNFGIFDLRHRNPRIAHNPKTLQKLQVPEKYAVKFKPGKNLKEKVRKLGSDFVERSTD